MYSMNRASACTSAITIACWPPCSTLRDLGNTLIVVEHDEDTIRAADYVVDIGPGAGVHGGHIVAQGSLENLLTSEESLTGAYLSGRLSIPTPAERRSTGSRRISLVNCQRNNLNGFDIEIPLGRLVCVTGVSGSGKSTLVNDAAASSPGA